MSRTVKKIKGDYRARSLRLGIVVSQFNEAVTNRLLEGCVDTLIRHGAKPANLSIYYTPGAFEIPLVAQQLIVRKRVDAVITLSVVIKGRTRHFDQVVTETARGIRELSQRYGVPVILGIIAADRIEDVLERTGIKHMNKGREWALAAIEMARLMKRI
jgi:6,7-dimethyl-8-ribityllumazine synthase